MKELQSGLRKFSGLMGKSTVLVAGCFHGCMRKKMEAKQWRGLETQSLCFEL